MDKWNGLFYNWYNTEDGSLKKDWGEFISQVDNSWLSAGLIVIGQAYPELHGQFEALMPGIVINEKEMGTIPCIGVCS
ncbi:hypothetical protein [Paenibacillus wulumuqiensis]|uniref:hypothetical protein n=1 Tax=Paenibacillus wulumuqiensis TaxID=1567107 RepID=UPI000619D32D|nr:hypothetical protein [Paenibacillus wulumuqiensis]